jgi:SET domain-containing protein
VQFNVTLQSEKVEKEMAWSRSTEISSKDESERLREWRRTARALESEAAAAREENTRLSTSLIEVSAERDAVRTSATSTEVRSAMHPFVFAVCFVFVRVVQCNVT